MKEKRRRLIKLVPDPKKQKLQIKYAYIIVASCVGLTIMMAELFHINSLLINCFFSSSKNGASLIAMKWGVIICFILIISAYIALLSILAINLSHQLVGPLYRIESILKEALETGKAPVFKLRKNDELHETVDLLNRLFEKRFPKKSND